MLPLRDSHGVPQELVYLVTNPTAAQSRIPTPRYISNSFNSRYQRLDSKGGVPG